MNPFVLGLLIIAGILLFLISIVLYLYFQHISTKPVPTLILNDDLSGYILSFTIPSHFKIEKMIFSPKHRKPTVIYPFTKQNVNIHGKDYTICRFEIILSDFSDSNFPISYHFTYLEGKKLKSRYFKLNNLNWKDGGALRISLFGDVQMQEPLGIIETFMMYLVRKIGKPHLIISMGDLVHYHDNLPSWNHYFRIMRKLFSNTPFYTTVGNHCGKDGGLTASHFFMIPKSSHDKGTKEKGEVFIPDSKWCYTFKVKNTLFISINTLTLKENDDTEQLDLLREQLKNRGSDIKFTVFWSHIPYFGPPYNKQKYTDHERFLGEKLTEIFDECPVDLQFFGHKHAYIREGNKIVTGSIHGVRKYPEAWEENYKLKNRHHFCTLEIMDNRMVVKAITWWGSEMDRLEINKQ